MMNYLKYESSAEAFLAVHHNFDKLETSIKLIHTNINTYQEEDTIINKIQDIEKQKYIILKNMVFLQSPLNHVTCSLLFVKLTFLL